MALTHPKGPPQQTGDLSVLPIFELEVDQIPRNALLDGTMAADVAYQIVHDELMLDGNARLNLATFVTTWAEPQARQLMAESLDKNMIDKDEYPRTADLENRCVHMLADLWHAPDPEHTIGCSTTGEPRNIMLVNLGTAVGGLCFLAGALFLFPERTASRPMIQSPQTTHSA